VKPLLLRRLRAGLASGHAFSFRKVVGVNDRLIILPFCSNEFQNMNAVEFLKQQDWPQFKVRNDIYARCAT